MPSPDTAADCRRCHTWGLSRSYRNGLCRPCADFEGRHPTGSCEACGRRQPVMRGFCRSCWSQAYLDRERCGGTTYTPLLPFVQRARFHQLVLGGIPGRRRDRRVKPARRRGVGVGAPGLSRKPPPPFAGSPAPVAAQLRLFDDLPRTYDYGRLDRRSTGVPNNPWLAWGLHLAHTLSEARGWTPVVRGALERVLVMLLSNHLEGERIRYSDFAPVVRRHGDSVKRTVEVLDAMGILLDDRENTFDVWLDRRLVNIAPGIQLEVRQWANTLGHGGPRTHARDRETIRTYLRSLHPHLVAWSARYDHLREVSADDTRAALAALNGWQRMTTYVALRSLFGWTKRHGTLFRNPMLGITNRRVSNSVWQPLPFETIAGTATAANNLPARVFLVLSAVHASRPGQIRAMQLTDVDLGNRRLTIAGRARPLDDLTRRVLTDWLTYRAQTWPNTANPYLLINPMTAVGVQPVSHMWIRRTIIRTPATLEQLRIDRQLEEALACGADPLHLAAVFGMAEDTAVRYARNARQLLHEVHDEPSGSPRTPAPTPAEAPNEPPGSS